MKALFVNYTQNLLKTWSPKLYLLVKSELCPETLKCNHWQMLATLEKFLAWNPIINCPMCTSKRVYHAASLHPSIHCLPHIQHTYTHKHTFKERTTNVLLQEAPPWTFSKTALVLEDDNELTRIIISKPATPEE